MAGKASKSAKANKSKTHAKPAKSMPQKSAPPAAPAKKPAAAAPAPKPAPAPTPAAPAPGAPPVMGGKKRNVKRGAPPMLPRRIQRRPDPLAPGAPPPPRPVTPPGSLHAPARTPEGAEGLKQRLSQVMSLISQLRALKRTLNRQFFEAGLLLQKLSEPNLYQAKGYGSFESFLEREVERELGIGRTLAHDLVQIVKVFQREPAEELGLERLRSALRALWPEPGPVSQSGAAG
jgi:hypothetical protein